ncbi:hypothetical protein [Halosolutus gelatinilyticus]|uniref:hypothetical protein n=1 Tax=Halosolutus gelatinilyticus TaxID=2931975 RepID=UPI001FF3BA1E|nr:hypothetical protein [Halosolutus gelatinilyticus]
MSWVAQLPGMRSGHRVRNVALGIGYALVLLPIAVVIAPLLAVGAVATNYRDAATRLSGLPGVDSGGGMQAGVVAGVYVFALWGAVLGAGMGAADLAGDSGEADADQPASIDATSDNGTAEQARSEEELLVFFETNVQQWGVELRSVELSDNALVVEYYANTTSEEGFTNEMAYLIGTYVDTVDAGLETERMDVTGVDSDDDSDHVYWHVESEWAKAYLDEELTEEDVFDRVFETVEVV